MDAVKSQGGAPEIVPPAPAPVPGVDGWKHGGDGEGSALPSEFGPQGLPSLHTPSRRPLIAAVATVGLGLVPSGALAAGVEQASDLPAALAGLVLSVPNLILSVLWYFGEYGKKARELERAQFKGEIDRLGQELAAERTLRKELAAELEAREDEERKRIEAQVGRLQEQLQASSGRKGD
jgi:hypothetical protein